MTTNNCLNCSEDIVGKFCHTCGQKTNTHRITVKHFVAHDLIHGVWHIDKGIPFTLKEIFTRPGYAALDYIAGKRVMYYNVFYMILIVVGFLILAGDIKGTNEVIQHNSDISISKIIVNAAAKYFKYILFSLIPLLALNSFLLFRKLKLNYAENLIIAGFCLLGSYVIVVLSMLLGKFSTDFENIIGPFSLLFPIIVYYQATKGKYKLPAFILRIITFYLLLLIEILALFIIVAKVYKAIIS